MSAAAAISALFRRYASDPVALLHDFLPRQEWPREEQCEILDAIAGKRSSTVAAHRGWGKTRTAAYASLWFLPTHANSLVLTTAPIWDQVIGGIWADIRHLWAVSKLPSIFPSWEILTHAIKTHPLTPKWRAAGAASDEVSNLEGKHPAAGCPALILGDECKSIPDPFFSSLQGMLAHADSRFFGIGTPGLPIGWFYESFTKNRADFWQRQYRADQSPRPEIRAKCEEEGKRCGWDDPFFRQQWLAEFTGGDEGAVIPLSLVQPAIDRVIEPGHGWRAIASLDVASTGKDETVLSKRLGPLVLDQRGWQGWDIVKSENRVMQIIREWTAGGWRPEALVVDETGVGEGVTSHLRLALKDSGVHVFGFRGGARPRDRERYENLKAEEVFMLRERFRSGEISIPNIPKLVGQLCAWTAEPSRAGKTKIVDPSDSPDYADSCMMSFAADRLGQSIRGITPAFLQ